MLPKPALRAPSVPASPSSSTALAVALLALLAAAAPGLAQPGDLLISEYVEGSSLNKAVELYNGTGSAIDLGAGGYTLEIYFNGSSSAGTTVALTGVVADGDVYVVADDGADPAILAATDQTSTSSFFNGDDAVVIRRGGAVVDSLGQVGVDPGSEWGSGVTSTQDNTLRRKTSDCTPDTDPSDAFDPAVVYDGFPQNTFDGLGAHAATCDGSGPGGPDPLLLSEVVVTPTAAEFVEIHNPNAFSVDLSDVYLTDATFFPGGVFYYNVVTGSNAGGGGFSDFHARFPDGASIGAGEYQVVALAGSDGFVAEWGIAPDYELFEDGAAPDGVPDMREALPGSINGQGGLTNSGEVAILYHWDGASDLVTDLDYALWGDKDEAVDKSGVAIDGPDGDADATAYQLDTPLSAQEVIASGSHASGESFERVDLTEGSETQSGGNGVGGADETSENLSVTWAISATPTPGAGPAPPSGFVINEIHADPDSGSGDANRDGIAQFSDDEFVEIVNTSGAAVDLSGWTLADGFGVRHVFPFGTQLADGCGVVVFGGGAPNGAFGGFVVQTASSGALGLNNGGDTVTLADAGGAAAATASYGSEGGQNQSLTLDPDLVGASFVLHSNATGSGGALFSPGSRVDGAFFAGCDAAVPVVEIHEVQGAGLASPFAGQIVRLEGDVVTALRPDGFFVQTPDPAVDADPETSQGLFVFTGGAPAVAVGDEVTVEGGVIEFFDFTEISLPTSVAVTSSGLPLPAAVTFDDATPSPLQPQPATELERFEGMLVTIPVAVVGGPNQRFGSDPLAEVSIAAGADRPFREPGIEFPGLPGLPVWDGNPEVFELDPDRMGLPNQAIPAGSVLSATGVLGFEFGGYELWPTSLVVDPAPLPVPTPLSGELELTAGSLNVFRLFDDVDDPGSADDGQVVSTAEYQLRLGKLSAYVREVLRAPDVLAVQEAESLATLAGLASRIALDDPAVAYTAHLVEGNDVGGIDVGYLVREDRFRVDAVTQLAAGELLSVDGSLLHDRPPLLLEGAFVAGGAELPVSFLNLHLRSLGGIEDAQDGPRVRQKRLEQAQSVASIVQDLQTAAPGVRLVVLGDFNAFELSDGYVDVVGQVAGDFDPADTLLSGPDLVDPDLTVLTRLLPAGERYSFVFRGSAQALDHALVSSSLLDLVTGIAYGRGNADAPELLLADGSTSLRSSDHDGLAVAITADPDGDGVPIGRDLCADTVVPESVPTAGLLPNRFALVDGDLVFDTVEAGRGRGGAVFTLDDTAGCSCEQIIVAAGLGEGHVLHGCSRGEMEAWVEATPD